MYLKQTKSTNSNSSKSAAVNSSMTLTTSTLSAYGPANSAAAQASSDDRSVKTNSSATPDHECNMIRLHRKAESEHYAGKAAHEIFKGLSADIFIKLNKYKCDEIYKKTMKFNFSANISQTLPKTELMNLFWHSVLVPERIGDYEFDSLGVSIGPGYTSKKEHRRTSHLEFKYRREHSTYPEGEYIVMNVHLSPKEDVYYDRDRCALRFKAAFKKFQEKCAGPVMRAMEAVTQDNFKQHGFAMSTPSDLDADDDRNAYEVAFDRSQLAKRYNPNTAGLRVNPLADSLNRALSTLPSPGKRVVCPTRPLSHHHPHLSHYTHTCSLSCARAHRAYAGPHPYSDRRTTQKLGRWGHIMSYYAILLTVCP